jgi:hypothetical protein
MFAPLYAPEGPVVPVIPTPPQLNTGPSTKLVDGAPPSKIKYVLSPVAPVGPIIETPAGQPDVTFFGPNNVLVTELINISPGEPNVLVGSVMPVQRVFPDLLFVPATP